MRLPYRPNVCMLVYNRTGQLFLGQRAGAQTWQFPQGGAEPHLSLLDNVYKELEEELGLIGTALGSVTRLAATHRYDFAEIPFRWRHRWRGQEQSFWLVEFIGEDRNIRLDAHDPAEFSHWRWVEPQDLLRYCDPVRRQGYTAPLAEYMAAYRSPQA